MNLGNGKSLLAIPAGTKSRDIFDEAQKLEQNYGIIFLIDDSVFGSGTLVKIGDIRGILTAHHVATVPRKMHREKFVICYREDFPHTLEVSFSMFEHVVVGSSVNHFEHAGPDLSFLMITDDTLLSRFDSKKSFYPLGTFQDIQEAKEFFPQMPWWVSGSPEESSDSSSKYRDRILTRCSHIHAEATFHSLKEKGGFDYIRLKMPSGILDYPKEYGGMSGGGIWVLGSEKTTDGIRQFPILQGVLFYESRPYENGTKRLLIGHGPNSIHGRVVDELTNRDAAF